MTVKIIYWPHVKMAPLSDCNILRQLLFL